MRVSRSSACRLLIPRVLKKSSFGFSADTGTLKCSEASRSTSSVVFWSVGILFILPQIRPDSSAGRLGQIGKRVGAFDELPQPRFHRRPRKQLAENIHFLLQLRIRNRLDEFLGRNCRAAIKLRHLRRSRTRHSQRVAFPRHLAHEPNRLGLRRVDAAPRQKQVPHHAIPNVALEPRNAPKAWYQSKPQLGKTESRHLIRHNQIAKQRQLKSTAESNPVHRRDRRKRSRINRISYPVNPLDEIAHAGNPLRRRQRLRAMIQLAQICPGAKTLRARAGNNQCVAIGLQKFERGGEFLKLRKSRRANLIARRPIENQLDNATLCTPRQRVAAKILHVLFFSKSRSISAAKCATIASRFSFPFAVSMPFSMVSGSGTI